MLDCVQKKGTEENSKWDMGRMANTPGEIWSGLLRFICVLMGCQLNN